MPLFVVTYDYTDDVQAHDEIRPSHRAYIGGLDTLVASGPTDAGGAVLIFEAASAEEVAKQLDDDPFKLAGFIVERRIAGWTPILGRWVTSGQIP